MEQINFEIEGHKLSLIKYDLFPQKIAIFLDQCLITSIDTELAFKILYNFAESITSEIEE